MDETTQRGGYIKAEGTSGGLSNYLLTRGGSEAVQTIVYTKQEREIKRRVLFQPSEELLTYTKRDGGSQLANQNKYSRVGELGS